LNNTFGIGSIVKVNGLMKKCCTLLAVFCQYYLYQIICNLAVNLPGFRNVWQYTQCPVCYPAMACLPHWCWQCCLMV